MEKSLQITVFGKVQGVFFRKHAFQTALQLGLKGYDNEPKGWYRINSCTGQYGGIEPISRLGQNRISKIQS